jgi:hypothetical protein
MADDHAEGCDDGLPDAAVVRARHLAQLKSWSDGLVSDVLAAVSAWLRSGVSALPTGPKFKISGSQEKFLIQVDVWNTQVRQEVEAELTQKFTNKGFRVGRLVGDGHSPEGLVVSALLTADLTCI